MFATRTRYRVAQTVSSRGIRLNKVDSRPTLLLLLLLLLLLRRLALAQTRILFNPQAKPTHLQVVGVEVVEHRHLVNLRLLDRSRIPSHHRALPPSASLLRWAPPLLLSENPPNWGWPPLPLASPPRWAYPDLHSASRLPWDRSQTPSARPRLRRRQDLARWQLRTRRVHSDNHRHWARNRTHSLPPRRLL